MSNLPHEFGVLASCKWNASGFTLRAGESYRIEPVPLGQKWKDGVITCGPAGWEGRSGGFFSFVLFPLLRVRRIEGRVMRYFSLIGCVGRSLDHAFLIAEGCTVRPSVGGELFTFANDADLFYCNNQGKITATITSPSGTTLV